MSNGKVLPVPAVIDATKSPDGQPTTWLARATGDTPLADLYAYGDSFTHARRNLAELVWLAVVHGAVDLEVPTDEIAAVRVYATTRKTFPVAGLAVTS